MIIDINPTAARILEHNPKTDGWASDEKAVRMAQIVNESESKISVELGVYGGRGVIAMAMAHQAIGEGVAWGFDPWSKEAALEGENDKANDEWWAKIDLEAIYRVFVEKVHSHALLPWLYWARLKSAQAVTLFEDKSISVIHADSNHSEKVSCDEVERWTPKLKPGGFWFADDIDWATTKRSQGLLLTKGMVLIEDHKSWALYQKIRAT